MQQPTIIDSFTTIHKDTYIFVQHSPTHAEILFNNIVGYALLTPKQGVYYMDRLKKMYSSKLNVSQLEVKVGPGKICICKCHNGKEVSFAKTKHCSFCSGGRFVKEAN